MCICFIINICRKIKMIVHMQILKFNFNIYKCSFEYTHACISFKSLNYDYIKSIFVFQTVSFFLFYLFFKDKFKPIFNICTLF